MHAFTSLVALAIDTSCGYPQAIFARIGHPVSWMGRLIACCERRWNAPRYSFARRRINGAAALLLLLAVTAAASVAFTKVIDILVPAPFNALLLGLAASTLIAQRSLYDHVAAVARALEASDLAAGQRAVGMIVGRDTAVLDQPGVSRAAIESLAENFSDGVVAPLLWLLVGGLPAAALYKAVNTADSMIGHKSDRYRAFGWAAARLDDLVNLPASRLSAALLILAAAATPGCDAPAAMRTVAADARRHRSPNAGWPEAAMAGALGIALAGPRSYGGEPVHDAWIGAGRLDLTASDIRRALHLFRLACLAEALLVAAMACVALLVS